MPVDIYTASGAPWLDCSFGYELDDASRGPDALHDPARDAMYDLRLSLNPLRATLAEHGVHEVYVIVSFIEAHNEQHERPRGQPRYRRRGEVLEVESYLVDDESRPTGQAFTEWLRPQLRALVEGWDGITCEKR
jgi:hypothetical protein